MEELLQHALDAPLPNILILAGLMFLGIGVVGKISGKIEPGTWGRIMSGTLGAGLFMGGLQAHSIHDAEQSLREPRLTGIWTNENAQTRGITRLEIDQTGNLAKVHAWSSCHPHDCDWGTEQGTAIRNTVSTAWQQDGVLRKTTLNREGPRLRVALDSVYRDKRPSQHTEEYFVRPR
jgi:hypothetical protein